MSKVAVIGKRANGTLLGEDKDGNLYVGTPVRVGYDQIKRIVTETPEGRFAISFVYMNDETQIISAGEVEMEPEPWESKPEYNNVNVWDEATESVIPKTIEVKCNVIDWELLNG